MGLSEHDNRQFNRITEGFDGKLTSAQRAEIPDAERLQPFDAQREAVKHFFKSDEMRKTRLYAGGVAGFMAVTSAAVVFSVQYRERQDAQAEATVSRLDESTVARAQISKALFDPKVLRDTATCAAELRTQAELSETQIEHRTQPEYLPGDLRTAADIAQASGAVCMSNLMSTPTHKLRIGDTNESVILTGSSYTDFDVETICEAEQVTGSMLGGPSSSPDAAAILRAKHELQQSMIAQYGLCKPPSFKSAPGN